MFVVVELANVVADRTQLSSPATPACATRSMAGRTSACECVNIRILVDSAMSGQKGGELSKSASFVGCLEPERAEHDHCESSTTYVHGFRDAAARTRSLMCIYENVTTVLHQRKDQNGQVHPPAMDRIEADMQAAGMTWQARMLDTQDTCCRSGGHERGPWAHPTATGRMRWTLWSVASKPWSICGQTRTSWVFGRMG